MPGGLQYSYLFQILFYLLVWAVLFARGKGFRRQMLYSSLAVAPMGPVAELFYRRDYWQPQLFNGWALGVEDVLWGFAIGGIGAVAYKVLINARYAPTGVPGHRRWLVCAPAVGAVWMVTGVFALGINSIYVSAAGFLVGGVSFLAGPRRDLLRGAMVNGILVGLCLFGLDIIFAALYPGLFQEWWMLDNLSGVRVAGIPVEEAMWGFSWGFLTGTAYEFVSGKVLVESSLALPARRRLSPDSGS